MRTRVPLAYQILAFQVGIIILSALAGTFAAIWQARQELDRQYEQRSLAIAQSVAATSSIQQALLVADAGGAIQQAAEQVRLATGATYVVVTDRQGIRYSHPNPALIGQMVDEDPAIVLSGRTWTGVQRGRSGISARGKAPVFAGGSVIGMVSVGFCESRLYKQLLAQLPGYASIVLLALVLGAGRLDAPRLTAQAADFRARALRDRRPARRAGGQPAGNPRRRHRDRSRWHHHPRQRRGTAPAPAAGGSPSAGRSPRCCHPDGC